tara:strand:+ start:609 stop:884 length:276 start_codon:yes stop_codon:yes gene_type:complete
MFHNFNQPKPVDWECTDYEYAKLQVLNSMSYNLNQLNQKLDAVDSTYTVEMLTHIVNSHAHAIVDVVEKKRGYYSGNYSSDTNNTGHYDGS